MVHPAMITGRQFRIPITKIKNKYHLFQTRKQALTCDKSAQGSIISIMKEMIVEEGKSRPLRGVSAMILGAGPAHAMYFGVLEKGKTMTQKYKIDPKIGDGN